jgi:hypothetical protein
VSLDVQADRIARALAAQHMPLAVHRSGPGRSAVLAAVPSVASPAIIVATSQSQAWPASSGGRTTSQAR